jgi:hypothetical protein
MTTETEVEAREKLRGQLRFNELCIWLNKCEIEFKIFNWESGEGRDIIINYEKDNECVVSFYESGYIKFNDEDGE